MELNKLEDALREATRFVIAGQEAIRRLKADKYANIGGSPETATCRRASMDLTRALAKLRRCGNG